MPVKAPNLLAAMTNSGSIARMGEVTILRMDGAGAIAAASQDFTTVSRWAQGRPASEVMQKNRMQFLGRFDMFFAKTNSIVQTRGSTKPLYDLLKSMERIGLDIHEWSIPHSVEEMLKEASGAKSAPEKPPKAAPDTGAKPA